MESPENFVWICPSCERRVPKRFEECRCGFRLTDTGSVVVGEALEPEEPRRSSGSRSMLMVGAGLLLGLGLAAVPLRSFLTPAETTAPRVVVRPASAAATPAPVASSSAPASSLDVAPSTPSSPEAPAAPTTTATSTVASLEDVIARTLPAVVSIQAGMRAAPASSSARTP